MDTYQHEEPDHQIQDRRKTGNLQSMAEEVQEPEPPVHRLSKVDPDLLDLSEEEDDEDDYDDEEGDMVMELAPIKKFDANAASKFMPTRSSVSAEAYGNFNKSEKYVPKVVPKDEKTKLRIRNKMRNTFIFKTVDREQQDILIDAMDLVNYKEKDMVIT